MEYDFHEGFRSRSWVLFHGTGGSREDLLPFARMIDAEASIVALGGDVEEDGMWRFFTRQPQGVIDEADLKKRTDRLHRFLDDIAAEHGLDRAGFMALGYSNGANMAASLLLRHGDVFKAAFLLHPMCPYRNMPRCDLSETGIFISAGRKDPIIAEHEPERLFNHFLHCEARPMIHWHDEGHKLTMGEMSAACRFYRRQILPSFYD